MAENGGKTADSLLIDSDEASSDYFRINLFKVKRCPRGRPHDWTCCPYAHPGEKAKRRDPRRYQYSGTACPDFRKSGCCRRGDACPFAHGVFECWLHPQRYRTQLCADGTACKRRVCFFAHVESELRKPEEAAPPRSANDEENHLSGAQLLQHQQLKQALSALLANGPAASAGQNGSGHAGGGEAREDQSSSPVNPLAERAWQLQQQLQQLQALQVMQSQQHAAAGSQRSSFDGRSSLDGVSVGIPHSQAGAAGQALVQQQLQAQVDQEMLPMLGSGSAGSTPRGSSPFPLHQSSMEAVSLLQSSQPAALPVHGPANGLTPVGSLPRPDMLPRRPPANGFAAREAFSGELVGVSHADLLASGIGGFAGPRRMSLDSAMPPRPPPAVNMRGANGLQQWPPNGMHGGIVDPALLAALQLSQRAMAVPPLSGRSSMDGPHPGEHARTAVDSLPQLAAGFRDSSLYQLPRGRGSLDLPPIADRGLPDQRTAAGHDLGWAPGGHPLPQRRSIDIGSVQRQGYVPQGSDYGLQLQPTQLPFGAHHPALDGRADSGSPAMFDSGSPLLPTTAPMAAHEHTAAAAPAEPRYQAQGQQVLGESHPPVSHDGHLAGVTQHRLATVGEGAVSLESGFHGDIQLKPTLANGKVFAESATSVAGNPSIIRNASFDSILADLPRSLSEVHLQQHGPLSPTMDGPVKLDS